MQLAVRIDERPDESHMALDGKKSPDESDNTMTNRKRIILSFSFWALDSRY